MKKLGEATDHVVVYIDATGGVCRTIPSEDDAKDPKLLNYAICVRSPLLGSHPVAICEFILDDQSEPPIYNALRVFHQK